MVYSFSNYAEILLLKYEISVKYLGEPAFSYTVAHVLKKEKNLGIAIGNLEKDLDETNK